jgi:N-acetylmuramoyl-L-alanine amidase
MIAAGFIHTGRLAVRALAILHAGLAWSLLACAVTAPVGALAQPNGAIAGSNAIHTEANAIVAEVTVRVDDKGARLDLLFNRPVEPQVVTLDAPDRLVLEFPATAFQTQGQGERRAQGLVAAYRYGFVTPTRSRLVIDLRAPAQIARIERQARAGGEATLLSIDLQRVERDVFTRAARESEARLVMPPPPRPDIRPDPSDPRPVVVLDPGHGGIDPGASAPGGIQEKALVLAFAQRLRDRIERSGRARVVLTRDDDTFLTLSERVAIARRVQADLFVSIHADTLSGSPEVRGATVYTSSERASDVEAARLAEKENLSDANAGSDTQETESEIADILSDLALRETRLFSQKAAHLVVSDMNGILRLHKNPRRAAGFRVLTAPDVPSILIELGYLSSAEDLALLRTEEWRDKATGAIARAIDRYLAGRGRPASVSP